MGGYYSCCSDANEDKPPVEQEVSAEITNHLASDAGIGFEIATSIGEEIALIKTVSTRSILKLDSFVKEGFGRPWDFYERMGELGEGGTGTVWLARQRIRPGTPNEHAGRTVAVKRVRKPNPAAGLDELGSDSAEAHQDFHMEVELIKSLDHPSICKLLEVFQDTKNIHLVMEHIKGRELFDRIVDRGFFNENDAAAVIRQVASALVYCHQHDVIHRDIKPENIMCMDLDDAPDEVKVKLIDFGFACRFLHGVQLKAKVGTFPYSAPEVLKDDPCSEKLDLWSLGCVLYAMLSGTAPFSGVQCRNQILQGCYSLGGEPWALVSDEAKAVIGQLLAVDPANRLTAAELIRHHWLVDCHSGSSQGALDKPANRTALLQNLESFKELHKQSLCRHICVGVLARQLDESMLYQQHCDFVTMDENGDGIISFAEFKRSYIKLGIPAAELENIFQDVDLDDSFHIDYTEFVAACIDQRVENTEGACWAAFEVFDQNGDGLVSFEEFRQVVGSASVQSMVGPEELEEVWSQLTGQPLLGDVAHGNVDFDDFLAALHGVKAANVAAVIQGAQGQPKADKADAAKVTHPGLPICKRQRAVVQGMGLPIAKRH